ncbi:GntR family transcriptional regulator [Pseudonocardia alni]|uniref:GntR family transcriptional regulator n=1 Tax=Pseudonocardia alni TaxID=33907 RepID=UPI00332EE24F
MSTTSRRTDSSLAATVAATLRDAILGGEFALGEALSEESIATALEVSRTPVREAVRRLRDEGLVDVVPKSGTYVFRPTEADLAELCEYRVMLELQAVRLSSERAAPATLAGLRDSLAAMQDALHRWDLRTYSAEDGRFHQQWFDHCGNRYLADAYRGSIGRIAALRARLSSQTSGEPPRSLAEHEAMVELFAAGRVDELAALLEEHVLRSLQRFRTAVGDVDRRARDPRPDVLRLRLLGAGAGPSPQLTESVAD